MDIQGTLSDAKGSINHTDECDSKYIVSCHVFDFQS